MASIGAAPDTGRFSFFAPLLFTTALALWWACSIWTANRLEIAGKELPLLAAYGALVLALQGGIYLTLLGAVRRRRRLRDTVASLLNAAFLVFNLYTIVLVHSESVESRNAPVLILLLTGLLTLGYGASKWIPPRALAGFATMALLHSVYLVAVARIADGREELRVSAQPLPSRLRIPDFPATPNVYLISLDSLVPDEMTHRFLGVEKLRYVEAIEEANGQILKNVFSEGDNTNMSLNSLLALDVDWWRALPYPESIHLETGRRRSPVYEIFQRNGYRVQFIYSSAYFGPKQFAGVDFYGTADEGICHHISNKSAFLGYCSALMTGWRSAALGTRPYPEYLFDRLELAADSETPWLTMAHIWMPGHTGPDYLAGDPEKLDEYREYFLERADTAAEYIQSILSLVQDRDPDGVVLLYGDHGMWVSRGLDPEDLPPDSPYSEKEVVQDRHAVLAALFPADFCQEWDGEAIALPRVLRKVITCLAGGSDPLANAPSKKTNQRFRPYAYEPAGTTSIAVPPLP